MRDGLLVKTIDFDETLKPYGNLRILRNYMNDFTDFCEIINETCEKHNLIVEMDEGTDGGQGYYTDSVQFHFYNLNNDWIGSLEVVVLINAYTCINEFKKRIN